MSGKLIITFVLFFFSLVHLAGQKNNTRPSVEGPDGYKVSSFSGSLFQERQDFFIESVGPDLDFSFTYTSNNRGKNYGYGYGWRLKMHKTYVRNEDQMRIVGTDGGTKTFTLANGTWGVCFFAEPAHRQVTSIEDRCQNRMTFTYADTLLTQITDHTSRAIDLEWTDGLMTKLSHNLLDEERAYTYEYDGDQRLVKTTNPMGFVVEYSYDDGNRLVRVINENGVPTLISYHRSGGVKKLASCDFAMSFTYNQVQNETYVCITTYSFDDLGRNSTKDGNCCGLNIAYTYDDNNNIVKKVDGNSNARLYSYDQRGNPVVVTDANGASESFEYSDDLNQIVSYSDQLDNTTSFTYDAKGNLLTESNAMGGNKQYTYDAIGNVASYTNTLGYTTEYTYDAFGYLNMVVLPDSATKITVYDAVGNLLEATDENGGITYYKYDRLNRMTRVVNPLGYASFISYDAINNPVEYVDELGNTFLKEYDGLNQLIVSTDAIGGVTKYTYDSKGNKIEEVDPNGYKYKYEYDDKGRLVVAENPVGDKSYFAYDAAGNKTSYTDWVGNTTTYFYDANNNLIKEVDALFNERTFSYDANGRLVAETDFLGNITLYEYDALGRTLRTIDPLGNSETNVYDSEGSLVVKVDGNGNSYKYKYDKRGRMYEVELPLGNRALYTFDKVGNRTSESYAEGHLIVKRYNLNNRLVEVINPIGLSSVYEYDSTGNKVLDSLPNGNVVKSTFDANNRLLKKTDSEGLIALQTYDMGGRVTSLTLSDSVTIRFKHNAKNEVIEKIYPDDSSERFEYDANGLLAQKYDRSGARIEISRNPINQVTTTVAPDNTVTNYQFDASGNLLATTDAKGGASSFAYDALGRQITITQPDGYSVEYVFDGNGNIIEKSNSINGSITYEYDANNRLLSKDFPDGTSCTFTYDNLDRITTATSPTNQIVLQYDYLNRITSESVDGVEVTYNYDLSGRVTDIEYPNGLTVQENLDYRGGVISVSADDELLASITYEGGKKNRISRSNGVITNYEYNENGNLARIEEDLIGQDFRHSYNENGYVSEIENIFNANEQSKFEYDVTGKLVSAIVPNYTAPNSSLDTVQFTYDKLGNRESYDRTGGFAATYTSTLTNQYSAITSNNTSLGVNYSSSGNLVELGTTNFEYDLENRLITVGNDATYRYDAFGRRAEKEINGSVTKYYYYKDRVIEVVDSNGESVKFIHGEEDLRVAMISDSLYYFHQDDKMSITALTNQEGDVVEYYSYSPYGELSVFSPIRELRASSVKENIFLYTASEYDFESGLYYMRARHYSPELGRFLQRDPVSFRDGLNLYQYARSNPVNFVDPYGLTSCVKLGTGRGGQDPLGFLRSGNVSILKSIFARERSVTGQWDLDGQICNECCEETKSYGPKLELNLTAGLSYNVSLNALPAIRVHPFGRLVLGTAVVVGGFKTKDLFGGLKGSVGISGSANVARSACGEWSGGGCLKFDASAGIEVSGEKDIDKPRFFGLIEDDVSLGVSLTASYEIQACAKCNSGSCRWECENKYAAKFNAWLDIEVSYWGNEFIEKASYEKTLASGGGPFQCPSFLPNLNR